MIGVSAEPKALTSAERAVVDAHNTGLGKVRMNTPNLRAAGIEALGERTYFNDVEMKWKKFIDPAGVLRMRLSGVRRWRV